MSFFRPVMSNACQAGRTPALRSGLTRQSIRGFADQQARPPPKSESNLPLYLGGAGLAGLGGYLYLDRSQRKNFATAASTGGASTLGGGALNPKEFREFVLKEVKPYNHDSATYVFELPDKSLPGLTVASAVVVKAAGEGLKDKEGKEVIRPYTPVTSPETAGHIDFLVKEYGSGNMSKHIHGLKPGDKLAIKGPIEKFQYKPNVFESVGMIAGGTGITPMFQVMEAIANNPDDKTKVTLLYSNKTEKDILLRERFDELAKSDDRFQVVYGLDKKPRGFANKDAFEGYISPEIISQYMPAPGKADKVKLFVCGPPGQVEAICGAKGPKGSQGELKGLLADAGYQPEQVYKF